MMKPQGRVFLKSEWAPISDYWPCVAAYLQLRAATSDEIDKSLKQEAFRMANLILARVRSGGEQSLKTNPVRRAPDLPELVALILRKWHQEQNGQCALCGGKLTPLSDNAMLQATADRIDSSNIAYDDANVQITHLACNFGKNQYGAQQFSEWLSIIKSASDSQLQPVDIGGT